jgi:PST family polysaccharide transporter
MAILRAAAPLGIATVMVQLLVNMDYVLVGVLASRFETAQYAAAYRVMLLVQGFGVAFHAAVLPTLTNQLSREGQASTLLRSLLTILFATVLPVSIVIGALAPELVLTIYGQAYAAAGPVLSVLAWQIPIEVVGTLYANMLIAQGRHRRYAAILGLGAALKFLLILALAPAFGALGVAFASVIALSVVVVSALMQARLAISIDPRAVVAIGSGMALLLVFLRLSGGAPMPLQIILGAIAYVGGCAASVALLALRVWPRGSTP